MPVFNLVFQKGCPECGSITCHRVRRSWWMRLIPRAKRYRCDECDHAFIVVLTGSAPQPSPAERREQTRLALHIPIQGRVSSGAYCACEIVDISAGGFQLHDLRVAEVEPHMDGKEGYVELEIRAVVQPVWTVGANGSAVSGWRFMKSEACAL